MLTVTLSMFPPRRVAPIRSVSNITSTPASATTPSRVTFRASGSKTT
jgi:hypothetical protein